VIRVLRAHHFNGGRQSSLRHDKHLPGYETNLTRVSCCPFDTIQDLKGSARNSLHYFQTVCQRLLTLICGRPKKASR